MTNNKPQQHKTLQTQLGVSLLSFDDDTQSDQNCPEQEQIAAYYDQKMTKSEQEQFLQKLLHCPDCYHQWIEMAHTLGLTRQRERHKPKTAHHNASITNWFASAWQWLSGNSAVLSGALASSFLLLMVLQVIQPDFEELPLNQQLVKTWHKHEVLDLAYIDINQFIPKGYYKSSLNLMPFPEKIAFSSGFKSGLIKMSRVSGQIKTDPKTMDFLQHLPDKPLDCEDFICQQENHLNQSLGTWSSFVLQECQNPQHLTPQYLYEQSIVLKRFIEEFNHLDQLAAKSVKHTAVPSRQNSLLPKVYHLDQSIIKLQKNSREKPQLLCQQVKQLALYSIQGL